MSRIVGFLACLVVGISAHGQDLDHTEWTSFLQKYETAESRVNYAQLKSNGTVWIRPRLGADVV